MEYKHLSMNIWLLELKLLKNGFQSETDNPWLYCGHGETIELPEDVDQS